MVDTPFISLALITPSRTTKLLADNGTANGAITPADILGLLQAGAGVSISASGVISVTASNAASPGSVSVLSYGALGDNSTDDGPAFNSAIAAAGPQGLVIVPPAPGGAAYKWKTPVSLLYGCSMRGVGRPQITWETSTVTADALTFGHHSGEANTGPFLESIRINGSNTASLRGRDLVRVTGGVRLQIRDVHLFQSGRDALHMETANDGDYIECTQISNLSAFKSGRDGIRIETGNFNAANSITYINQTVFYMVDIRDPGQASGGGYALTLMNNATSNNANGKISCLTFINGELCATGNQQPDGIWMQCTNAGAIEKVAFVLGCTIEDVNAAHAGYGINGSKGGGSINSVTLDGLGIFYGFSSGQVNRSVIGA